MTSPNDLGGRQVREDPAGNNTDNCWFQGSMFPTYTLSGGGWNVGYYSYNMWADDYVGMNPNAVSYYRLQGRVPCTATAGQRMSIYYLGNTGPSTPYRTTSVGVGLPTFTDVSSSRDGQTVSKQYPE